MTKLEQMIKELCSEGVEYRPFGEMAYIVRGASPRPIKAFITAESDGVNWIKIGDVKPSSKYITETAEKITPEGAKKSRLVKEGDFILSNSMSFGRPYIMKTVGCIHDGWLAISDFDEYFLPDFLYHLLNSNKYQHTMRQKASFGGAVQNLNADIVKELEMPIIPLEIQAEIVRILDEYSTNADELNNLLKSELEARKKQYEYYRDKLLDFETAENERGRVQLLTLGDIGPVCMCKRILKSETSPDGDIPFYKIGTFGGKPNAYISKETFEKYKSLYSFPKKGDILISAAGTIGRTVIYDGLPAYFQDSNIVWISNDEIKVLNKYLYYYYQLRPWNVSTGGTIARLYNDNISKAKIYVPPIPEQERIVAILDRFDKLCNDISEGLPAEIEARKKQYEYYRDKLLTFEVMT